MTREPAPRSRVTDTVPEAAGRVRVWDPLVRALHWTLAVSFLGAYGLEDTRDAHETLGYVALAAVLTRVLWGFLGPGHARFSAFVPTPATFFRYVGEMLRGRERRYLGHNPAGGAMVVALLAAVTTLGATGWMMGTDAWFGVEWVETVHETVANLALGLVAFHVAGVVWESRRHGENLVAAMITGVKRR
jgi:cytochrome b